MNNISHLQKLTFFILLAVLSSNSYSQETKELTSSDSLLTVRIKKALNEVVNNFEESAQVLHESLQVSIEKKDTLNIIRCFIGITDIDRFKGNYNSAFDKLWDALLLAEEFKDTLNTIKIHRNLGILYSIYNKDSIAIHHLDYSSQLAKDANFYNKVVRDGQLNQNYFNLATIYRNKKLYSVALNYLDSCIKTRTKTYAPYVETEMGRIYLETNKLDAAESYLAKANRYFRTNDANYLVASHLFMGDLKSKQNQVDSAEYYYSKSLEKLTSGNVFLEYKSEVLKKLAQLNLDKNNTREAYEYLSQANIASDSLFNATNARNNKMFEIKNKYKEALVEKEKLIENQHLVIQQKNKIQSILSIMIILSLLLFGAGYFVYKLKDQLKKLTIQQQLENDKNNEVLEVKSKELTTYALQLIDKDQALNELLDVIKKEAPKKHNALNNKYNKGSNNLWEEFNMRFVKVNENFYSKLREKHPDITPTEQKHCALIKLNFDSMEMAKILNISVQSVHTSRYRIRKKIKLAHEESLSNYIASL